MGAEFKDKIVLHGFREVKCWWEVGEVGRWEKWKGNVVARWERWKGNVVARWERRENGKVGRWEFLVLHKGGEHRASPSGPH